LIAFSETRRQLSAFSIQQSDDSAQKI
jgi:hypothetical protein